MTKMNLTFRYNSDLLNSNTQLIAQQCNCTSKKAKGLAASIIEKYPYADFYSAREKPSKPGTIKLAGKKKERKVLAMFAQYYPGLPVSRDNDTYEMRKKWFQMCLDKISKIKGLKSIAFPHSIGCGLAGGEWKDYEDMLVKWSKTNPDIKIEIVSTEKKPVSTEDYLTKRILELEDVDIRKFFSEYLAKYEKEAISRHAQKWLDIVPKDLGGDYSSGEDVSDEDVYSVDDEVEEIEWGNYTLKEFSDGCTPKGWEEFFEDIIENEGLDDISSFLEKEVVKYEIFPPLDEVYTAFDLCPLKKLKVVIVGQDPYHTPGAAMGLAFGHHSDRIKVQPSLRNIYKAMKYDGFEANTESGDLSGWAEQGVFLINTALTVRKGEAGSHAAPTPSKEGPWSYFMGQLFRHINDHCKHIVVIMWGSKAQEYSKFFSDEKHLLIKAPHPVSRPFPINPEFEEHQPFSRTNKQLEKWKKKSIDWNLI